VPIDGQEYPIFPTTTADGYNGNHDNECPPITTEEVKLAVSQQSRGKTTRPDRIPNEILSLIPNRSPDKFVKMYNRCLLESVFLLGGKGPDFYFFIKYLTRQSLAYLAFSFSAC